MKPKNCEHELNLTFENWLDENSVEVEAECSLCKIKFSGVLRTLE